MSTLSSDPSIMSETDPRASSSSSQFEDRDDTVDTHSSSDQPADSDAQGGGGPSILSRLRAPLPSELSHKRKIRMNPPPKGVKCGKGAVTADPKSITPLDCVKAYPGENFTVSNNTLFCSACREEVAVKKSVVELHITSQKHKRGKERLIKRDKQFPSSEQL